MDLVGVIKGLEMGDNPELSGWALNASTRPLSHREAENRRPFEGKNSR